MRFIITAQASADRKATEQQSDFDVELFKAYMRFNKEMHRAGILVASEGLNPSAPGSRIAVANGKRYVVSDSSLKLRPRGAPQHGSRATRASRRQRVHAEDQPCALLER